MLNSLNFCKGLIKTLDLRMCSKDEIVAKLYNREVLQMHCIYQKWQRKSIHAYILASTAYYYCHLSV